LIHYKNIDISSVSNYKLENKHQIYGLKTGKSKNFLQFVYFVLIGENSCTFV